MADTPAKREPMLVAAWPGMGNVSIIAAGYLVQKLGMKPVAELSARGQFDIEHVDVKGGVIATPQLPRSVIYRAVDVEGPPLLVFLGQAQPTHGDYVFAHALLDRAVELGARRIVTFASLASQLHPTQDARAFACATSQKILDELDGAALGPYEDGRIAGLNGVLLGVAAERGMPGLCLLGEIPFFAAQVPNPKAAKAILDVFTPMAGLEIDLGDLERDAETVDRALLELLERMQQQGEGDGPEFPTALDTSDEAEEEKVDPAVRARIERLFDEATQDREKAMQLKRELDRHDLFDEYEDRFLDLFKQAD